VSTTRPPTAALLPTAVEYLRAAVPGGAPRAAVVLGSGLAGLTAVVEDPVPVSYRDIPGFPEPTVAGHRRALIFGRIGRCPVVLQAGRFHLYEGHDPDLVAFPVRVFAGLGVETLIVTNAAGGVRRTFQPPTLMAIADHLNLMFRNPLTGGVLAGEQRFPDMATPYDPELRVLATRLARELGFELPAGVYAGVLGPSYETPAEIRMLERFGADAVGMSTVPEVVAARARGLRVLGISAITNPAAGISAEPLSHEDVLAAGHAVREQLEGVVCGVLRHL